MKKSHNMGLIIIYKLINIVNNKLYVGQTWQTLKDRWHCGYKTCPYLYAAIKKYGYSSFKYEIITVCSTQEIADYWEDYFIECLGSRNPKMGYNIRCGGSRGKISEQTKKKISDSKIAQKKKMSKEFCEKVFRRFKGKKRGQFTNKYIENISKNHADVNGTNNPMYGKTHKDKTKQKISQKAIGRKASDETKKKLSLAAKGKPHVHSRSLTCEQIYDILEKLTNKISLSKIAKEYNKSTSTIINIKKSLIYRDYINDWRQQNDSSTCVK